MSSKLELNVWIVPKGTKEEIINELESIIMAVKEHDETGNDVYNDKFCIEAIL